MNATQLKIMNASRRMTVILKITGILTGIAAVLILIAIGILIFSKEALKQSFVSAFHVTANNGSTIYIASQSLLIMFCFALIDAILMTIIIFFVHAIFNDIEKHCTPFFHQNTVRIKRIAVITIVMSVIGSFSDALVDYYTIGELTWRINIIGLMIGLIIYWIGFIFNYGCDLQQLSDEIL